MKPLSIKATLLLFICSSCTNLEIPSVDTLDSISNVGSMKPSVGSVDLSQAVGAAADLGNAVLLSEDEIKTMAIGYAKESDSHSRVAPPSSPYVIRLAKLTNKHKKEDGLNLNYKVYLSKTVNAFALADGSIRVYSGIMDLMNDDELLAIIGHEIGHVKEGHSAGRIRLANAASGVKNGVGSTSNLAGALANEELVGGMLEKVINSQFSQSQETESDEYGVSFLRKHGYKLDGAVSAFNKLAKLSGKKGFMEGIMSSHPASEERAKHLAELIGDDSSIKVAVVKDDEKSSETSVSEDVNEAKVDTQQVAKSSNSSSSDETLSKNEPKRPTKDNGISLDTGWYIQVGAFKNSTSANDIEGKVKQAGLKVGKQESNVNDATFHRVLVGPYSDRNMAEDAKERVSSKLEGEVSPFVRFIQ